MRPGLLAPTPLPAGGPGPGERGKDRSNGRTAPPLAGRVRQLAEATAGRDDRQSRDTPESGNQWSPLVSARLLEVGQGHPSPPLTLLVRAYETLGKMEADVARFWGGPHALGANDADEQR